MNTAYVYKCIHSSFLYAQIHSASRSHSFIPVNLLNTKHYTQHQHIAFSRTFAKANNNNTDADNDGYDDLYTYKCLKKYETAVL